MVQKVGAKVFSSDIDSSEIEIWKRECQAFVLEVEVIVVAPSVGVGIPLLNKLSFSLNYSVQDFVPQPLIRFKTSLLTSAFMVRLRAKMSSIGFKIIRLGNDRSAARFRILFLKKTPSPSVLLHKVSTLNISKSRSAKVC